MLNLAFFNAILKEDYLGPIRDQLNNATIMLQRLKRNEEDVGGRIASVPLHTGRNSGVGARADGGNLPAAGRQGYNTAQYLCAYNYGRIQVTGPTIAASRKDKYAFVKAVDSEIKGMVKDLKDDLNRQLFGDRSGIMALCTVANGAGAATFTVDNPQYIQTGMIIDNMTGVAAPVRFTRTVTAVNRVTGVVTVSVVYAGAADVAIGDAIVRSGNFGLEMMGLLGIVNDANTRDGQFVGALDRTLAANGFWDANVLANGGVARNLTLDLMQQGFDASEIEGGEVSLITTSYAQRRRYLALVKADGRFVNNLKMDGGWDALDYNGKPLVVDRHMLPGMIYFLDEKTLELYRMSDFDWMDMDGSVLSRVAGVDAYEATLYKYATLGCGACNNNTVIEDLA